MHPDPTSWHEAGHAAVAFLLGGEVLEVTIESEDDDRHGHTKILWPPAHPDDHAERTALTALAGPVAESRYRGNDLSANPFELLSAWAADWREATPALRHLAPNPAEQPALLRRLVGTLNAEFEDPDLWERVARLADMLHAHGTLDESLVAEVLQ